MGDRNSPAQLSQAGQHPSQKSADISLDYRFTMIRGNTIPFSFDRCTFSPYFNRRSAIDSPEPLGMHFIDQLKYRLYLKLIPILPYRLICARQQVAWAYLKGNGIEIGALHNPLPLPRKARTIYVDRMSVPDLKQHYAEFKNLKLAPVSIIANGETLEALADQSQDFVIGNHLIEHAQDPIKMLKNWLRVLRPGGVIFMAVPDKRFTFDQNRPSTSIEHLIRDHRDGPTASRRDHYREWVEIVTHRLPPGNEEAIDQLDRNDHSIHFHVWDTPEFIEWLLYCRSFYNLPFEPTLIRRNGNETIFILSKAQSA